jgi:hypothetical protein
MFIRPANRTIFKIEDQSIAGIGALRFPQRLGRIWVIQGFG